MPRRRGRAYKSSLIGVGTCQKTIRHVEDEAMQRIINEGLERHLVAAYINGLAGIVGQQVRFTMAHTLEEAMQVVITVSNAERMRAPDTRRMFSTKREFVSGNNLL
jgi:hypothetical protein